MVPPPRNPKRRSSLHLHRITTYFDQPRALEIENIENLLHVANFGVRESRAFVLIRIEGVGFAAIWRSVH